ncbi:MAG: sortase domain-bontaining protein [Eubacterium sp.]
MSDEKGKNTQKKGIFHNYIIYITSFLIIALAITIVAIIIAVKPATELVHKIENSLAMEVRDVQINDGYYPSADNDKSAEYGDRIGNVSIESCGLNCNIYYGANRVSYRYGAGFSADSVGFGSGNVSVLKGFDETYFSSLEYAKIGDIITVTANDGVYTYQVTDTKYIADNKQAYQSEDKDMLVLCSIYSDFSNHSGEYLYVFADRINGEGN